MAISYQMTWIPSGRRWRKVYKGKAFVVSCRQLGTLETKEASWRPPTPGGNASRRCSTCPATTTGWQGPSECATWSRISASSTTRRSEAVDALLGAGSFDSLKAKAGTMLAGMEASSPERTVAAQIEGWKNLLRDACQAGQLSVGRYDAYCRNIGNFVTWIGPETPIDAIDEDKLEAFFSHLSSKVGSGDYSPQYAHTLLMTARQFVSRLAARKLIPLPGNIRDRRFRFNHSVAAEIETFTAEEVRGAADAAPERMRLYLLLMLNCGMYQNDIAELRQQEVDWKKGTITRPQQDAEAGPGRHLHALAGNPRPA